MAYDAFISYSHAADGRMAPILQRALHRFAKPWWKIRALSIFRDETDLAASSSLNGRIVAALDSARYFIFLASPRAAASKWCRIEIAYWLEKNPADTLLIVLTEGRIAWDDASGDFDWSVTDAVPPELGKRFANEPFWLDLSWAADREELSAREPRFQQTVARLAATLHGKSLSEISGEDVREHARTRRVAQAAIASILLFAASAGVGGFYAWQQRGQALEQRAVAVAQRTAADAARVNERRQREQAERNLGAAESMVDVLINDVVFGLRKTGLPKDKARTLLDSVSRSLDALDDGDDSGRTADHRLRLYLAMADNYLALGDSDAATRFGDMAVRHAERMMEREPANSDWVENLAYARVILGEIHYLRGDTPGALGVLRRVLALIDRQLGKDPASRTWRSFRAFAGSRLGMATRAAGDLPGALDTLQRSLADVAELEREGSLDYSDAFSRLLARSGLVEVLVGLDRWDEALSTTRDMLEDGKARAGEIENDLEWQQRLINANMYRGVCLAAKGDAAAALEQHRLAAEGFRRLLVRDGTNVIWQLDSIMNRIFTAKAEQALGRLPDAARTLRTARNASVAVLAQYQDHRLALHHLATSSGQLGQVLADMGDDDGAAEAFRAAIEAAAKVYELAPDAVQSAEVLMNLRINLAALEVKRGRLADAAVLLRDGRLLAELLADRNPDGAPAKAALADVRRREASVLYGLERFDEALAAFLAERSLRVALADRKGPAAWQDQWYSHENVARSLAALRRMDAARREQAAALVLAEKVVALPAATPDQRRDLFRSYQRAAWFSEAPPSDLAAARAHLERACAIAGGLQDADFPAEDRFEFAACPGRLLDLERRIAAAGNVRGTGIR